MSARRAFAIVAAAAALAGAACSKTVTAPPPDDLRLPPLVAEVHPPPRATGVFYDTDIWVRFETALDPRTVTTHNVYFKLDTERQPIELAYEPATHLVRIRPQTALRLRRTYTIELTPRIATADGMPLGETLISQFTTNGLRRIEDPLPETTATDESPFVTLAWTGTHEAGVSIRYRLYVGADSGAVSARAVTPIELADPYFVPKAPWPMGASLFWTVTAVNQTASESLDGPVWRFDTLPEGTPIDSIHVTATHWGTSASAICNASIICGGGRRCAIHWSFETLPTDIRLAGCLIRLVPSFTPGLENRQPKLHGIAERWDACVFETDGRPRVSGPPMAVGVYFAAGPRRYEFASDTLTAFTEAMIRRPGVFGYLLEVGSTTSFANVGQIPARVYFYRLPAGTRRAAGAR